MSSNTKIRPGHFCAICNRPLTMRQTIPSRLAKGEGRFCSRKCHGQWVSENQCGENHYKWRNDRVQHHCEICGTSFLIKQSLVDKGEGRFCSRKCRGRWQSSAQRGKNNPAWKGGKVSRTCENCESVFSVIPCMASEGRGRFCSRECATAWRSRNYSKENHYNWQGGKSFEPYPITFNRAFKHKVRKRDNYTCAICKKQESKIVHHINYIKDDTTLDNCITLCRSCHGKTGIQRDYWQACLTEIMQRKAACVKAEGGATC